MEIKVYATLRDVIGAPIVKLDNIAGLTVGQLLDTLCRSYPALISKIQLNDHELHPALHILVNGRDMRYLNGLETAITPQDVVRIFPPVGGGLR